jgi:nucleoside-diphosphate-sugar epimerase
MARRPADDSAATRPRRCPKTPFAGHGRNAIIARAPSEAARWSWSMSKVAFVAGATGASAKRLVEELVRQQFRVVGVSRNPPEGSGAVAYVPADLGGLSSLRQALSPHREITHMFYTARATHGESGVESVEENLAMLANALEAAQSASKALEHVHLVEGTKWYGMHIGGFKTPAREDDPRHLPPNFYYDQEDHLRERQKGSRWSWSATRPGYLIDFAPERPRNLISVVGAYAAICRELGVRLDFPGTAACWNAISEATDTSQLARAMVFLSTSPKARNEAFNITNGDIYRWRYLWPRVAELFSMPAGEVRPMRLAEWMADKEPVWQRIVARHGLKQQPLSDVALWSFGDFVFRQSHDVISSMTKIRRAGFHDVVDTEETVLGMLRQYREARVLP